MDMGQKEILDFAYNLSVELRRILSEFNSASHQLVDAKQRETDPVLDRSAAALDKQYYTMVRLMENLSDVRYLDDQAPLVMQYTDMVSLVGDICEKSEGVIGSGNRHIVFRCPVAKLVWGINVKAVERAVYHLLSNALKYSQDTIEVSLAEEKRNLILTVTDTGCGMGESAQEQALMVPKPTDLYTAVSGGFGLGLPIVQAIVIHHGGTLSIESQEGKGTEVRLAFPMADKANIQLGDVEGLPYITKTGYNPTLRQLADALDVEAFCLRNQG